MNKQLIFETKHSKTIIKLFLFKEVMINKGNVYTILSM
jgi:hypothetical protein